MASSLASSSSTTISTISSRHSLRFTVLYVFFFSKFGRRFAIIVTHFVHFGQPLGSSARACVLKRPKLRSVLLYELLRRTTMCVRIFVLCHSAAAVTAAAVADAALVNFVTIIEEFFCKYWLCPRHHCEHTAPHIKYIGRVRRKINENKSTLARNRRSVGERRTENTRSAMEAAVSLSAVTVQKSPLFVFSPFPSFMSPAHSTRTNEVRWRLGNVQ